MILEYKNGRGQTVRLATPDATEATPYWITEFHGGHGVAVENRGIKLIRGDGESYVGSMAKAREIRIRGMIGGMNTARDRLRLLETILPCDMGTLTATRDDMKRSIHCASSLAPDFNPKRGDQFTLELWCPDPYWEDAAGETTVEFDGWIGLFEFPKEIPLPDGTPFGFEWGTRETSEVAVVRNLGQIETGFVCRIDVLDETNTIKLIKVATQEAMTFNVTLEAGDNLTISTSNRNRWARVTRVNATVENAMGYIAPDFRFFYLDPGSNPIKMECDSGIASLKTVIQYKNRYVGV
jgi:hypothetical protein